VIDMAYLMLVGTGGWTHRWEIANGQDKAVSEELMHLGTARIGRLPLLDPETDSEVTFVVDWNRVAAAVIVPSPPGHGQGRGQYA
jgi:hypothetical protein